MVWFQKIVKFLFSKLNILLEITIYNYKVCFFSARANTQMNLGHFDSFKTIIIFK